MFRSSAVVARRLSFAGRSGTFQSTATSLATLALGGSIANVVLRLSSLVPSDTPLHQMGCA